MGLHLAYWVLFWTPHYKKDVELLKYVEGRAMKLLKEKGKNIYEEWLRESGLFSLQKRRLRGSITTWKKVAVRYIVISLLRYQVIVC